MYFLHHLIKNKLITLRVSTLLFLASLKKGFINISCSTLAIYRWICGLLLLLLTTALLAQQDIKQLTALRESALTNPGLLNDNTSLYILILAKQQWLGTEGAPTEQLIQFAHPLLKANMNIGASLSHYSIGYFDQVNLTTSYVYQPTWTPKISTPIAIFSSLTNYSIDFSDNTIFMQRQADPSIPLGSKINRIRFNMGLGVALLVDNWLKIGVTAPRLLPNTIGANTAILNTATIDPIYLITLQTQLKASANLKISPAFVIRKIDFLPAEIDVNTTVTIQELFDLGIGASWSNTIHSAHLNGAFRITSKWQMGLFYEWATAMSNRLPSGNFELYLTYQLDSKQRELSNPRFFKGRK